MCATSDVDIDLPGPVRIILDAVGCFADNSYAASRVCDDRVIGSAETRGVFGHMFTACFAVSILEAPRLGAFKW